MSLLSQDRRLAIYSRSGHWLWLGREHVQGAFDAVWLRLLDAETLARVDERFSLTVEYNDDSYNRQGLSTWEQRAIDAHFADAKSIIVTSAGGGREVLALRQQGRDVLGFEPHPELARLGSRLTESEGYGSLVLPSPRDRWPARGRSADGVIVGWGAYMLIAGREQRVRYLREAATVLPHGGPILLSFFVRPDAGPRWRTTARLARRLGQPRSGPPLENGDSLSPNRVHFFTRDEVDAELEAGGFRMVSFGDDEYGWAVGVRNSIRSNS